VPAPRQQYRTPPRRVRARAYVQFTPVTTANAKPARALLVALASAAGTDDYGNTFPQGIQVGPSASEAQIQLLPTIPDGNAAQIAFPMPPAALSNVPNITGGVAGGGVYADLLLSGPALSTPGEQDWVQLNLFSSGSGYPEAAMDFRYISTTGAVTVTAWYDGSGWTFGVAVSVPSLQVGGYGISSQPTPSVTTVPHNPNDPLYGGAGGTAWISGERAVLDGQIDDINANFSAIVAALQAAGIWH